MEAYKENSLVLRFTEGTDFGNEPKLIRSIFSKFDNITKKAGFKKDFNPSEIDLIRSIAISINRPEETKIDDSAI